MSSKIITLSKQLANQIAAGEVVERPVSVVKELIENALDAGATHIDIILKNGGIDLIEVRDNGEGISPEDLPKTIEKYSTSKISNLQDLYEVMTFGFRGEALASISSVSKFTLSSKQENATGGKSIFIGEDEVISLFDIAHERGTTVKVENLFYNTPARLNYLKQARTEYLKVSQCVQNFALSYPEIAFGLEHDGKQALYFPQYQGFLPRIASILGEEFAKNILEIDYSFSGFRISGIISNPKISFPGKTKQYIFVNHRSVVSPLISKAISDAYNRYIAHGTQPGFVLFIEVDPTQVDVNVHPRKMEVRFAGESTLFRAVYHAVEDILKSVSLISSSEVRNDFENVSQSFSPHSSEKIPQYYTGSGTKFKNYSPYTQHQSHPSQGGLNFSQAILGTQERVGAEQEAGEYILQTMDLHETPLGKIIGQVHNSYIVVQTQNGVMLLDQHALAERVIYEKLASKQITVKTQSLLAGVGMHLDVQEYEKFQEYDTVFGNMGFEIDTLSHQNIIIQTIPDFLRKQNIEKVFRNILSDISDIGSQGLDEVRHKIWAYTACRSAIKFGDPLTLFEMHALLRDAVQDYSSTCPHGRPVVWEMGLEELKKKYER